MAVNVEYSVLQWAGPGAEPKNFAIMLYDISSETTYWRFVDDWALITQDPDQQEYLALWCADMVKWARELGALEFWGMLEDTLSNIILISDRSVEKVEDVHTALEEIYARYTGDGEFARNLAPTPRVRAVARRFAW